jgi:hypothetical protein
MNINTGYIVRIDWQDHFSNADGWKLWSEIKNIELHKIVCTSVGVVIAQDDDQVVIAQNWHPAESGDTKVADFMVIIKGCIKKITVLKRKELK